MNFVDAEQRQEIVERIDRLVDLIRDMNDRLRNPLDEYSIEYAIAYDKEIGEVLDDFNPDHASSRYIVSAIIVSGNNEAETVADILIEDLQDGIDVYLYG